jgi:DNA-binding PadR family transcriptional regulator
MAKPTPTSFAILGFLAMRPWGVYELTKEMRDSLRLCWPRTDRRIYQEAKHLVGLGLAESTSEMVNGRRRTVYAITDAGRDALATWLEERTGPPLHEFEALLRTGFAEFGSREALLRTLEAAEQDAQALLRQAHEVMAPYIEAVGLNEERAHNLLLYTRFMAEYTDLIVRWSQEARAEVAKRPTSWPKGEMARLQKQLDARAEEFQRTYAEPLR